MLNDSRIYFLFQFQVYRLESPWNSDDCLLVAHMEQETFLTVSETILCIILLFGCSIYHLTRIRLCSQNVDKCWWVVVWALTSIMYELLYLNNQDFLLTHIWCVRLSNYHTVVEVVIMLSWFRVEELARFGSCFASYQIWVPHQCHWSNFLCVLIRLELLVSFFFSTKSHLRVCQQD